MAFSVLVVLLPVVVVLGESVPAAAISQNDLHEAMADMRGKSYHGFVILLNILNTVPSLLQRREKMTFFMLDDWHLSAAAITGNNLQDFILGHSIPSGLSLNDFARLPNRTQVPSGLPNRTIWVTNSRRNGMFINNARIVAPNVCLGSAIKCHGISTQIRFDKAMYPSSAAPQHRNTKIRYSRTRDRANPSKATNRNATAGFH